MIEFTRDGYAVRLDTPDANTIEVQVDGEFAGYVQTGIDDAGVVIRCYMSRNEGGMREDSVASGIEHLLTAAIEARTAQSQRVAEQRAAATQAVTDYLDDLRATL